MQKLCIFYWFGFPIPMEERFNLIKSTGFNGVILYWGDEHAHIDGDKALQPELARRNGLFIENIHTPFDGINSIWVDGIDGEDMIKKLSACLDDCNSYEIPTAVVHISQSFNPPPMNQKGLDRIKQLVEIAERKNINIALENLRRPDYLDYVFSGIQSDRLGFCYDSGHENCFTKGTDLLSRYGSKLMALHLHDNDGMDDQHLIPGEGNIDWCLLGEKLKKTGYTGPIALEAFSEFSELAENKMPENFLKRAYEAAKGIRGG